MAWRIGVAKSSKVSNIMAYGESWQQLAEKGNRGAYRHGVINMWLMAKTAAAMAGVAINLAGIRMWRKQYASAKWRQPAMAWRNGA